MRTTILGRTRTLGVACTQSVDARYLGQAYELTLPIENRHWRGDEVATTLHDSHRKRYGFASPDEPVEIVGYLLKAFMPCREIRSGQRDRTRRRNERSG